MCISVERSHSFTGDSVSFRAGCICEAFLTACLVFCPVYCSLILNHYRFGRARRKISGIQTISFFRQTNITAAAIKLRRLVFRSMATQNYRMREEKEVGQWNNNE